MLTMAMKKKEARVELRVDADDLKRWQAAADAVGFSLSNWIRQLCNSYAKSDEALRARSGKKGGRQ